MDWFKRTKAGVSGDEKKRDIPKNVWVKCNNCGEIIFRKELEKNGNPPLEFQIEDSHVLAIIRRHA